MAGFTENALVRKLQELNSSQQSIQTLSLWLIHHRKHHSAVVKTWFKELLKVKDGRQLTFMYLANDVIQNSKKKGPEYGQEFGKVLVESFKHMAKTGINTKTKHSLHRILNIWQERGVYDAAKIQEYKVAVDPNDAVPDTKTKTSSKRKSVDAETPEPEEPKKKPKTEREPKHERRRSETKVEVDGHIETHTTLSPKTPPGDPPEPEDLIKAVLELESSASSDEAVRERIASLPPEVSEISLLSKLEGKMPVAYHFNLVLRIIQSQIQLRRWLIENIHFRGPNSRIDLTRSDLGLGGSPGRHHVNGQPVSAENLPSHDHLRSHEFGHASTSSPDYYQNHPPMSQDNDQTQLNHNSDSNATFNPDQNQF